MKPILLLLVLGCTHASSTPDAGSEPPTYLAFQLGGDSTNVASNVDAIVASLDGATGDGVTRQLAFTVILSLNNPDDEMRQIIDDSFAIGEARGVAVAFHVDDSMQWTNRSDLDMAIENVEWIDWNMTPAPPRTWGLGGPAIGGPQICYESAAMRAETYRIAKEVIAAEVIKNLAILDGEGKGNLFAGVFMGWETRLDPVENATTGYCSLTQRGFSAANPPQDFNAELDQVVQRWAANWCQGLVDGGLSRERVYTHIPVGLDPGDSEHAPPSTAFNDASRPGFTAYEGQLDALLAAGPAQQAFDANDDPPWAVSEGTNAVIGTTVQVDPIPWASYLGRLLAGRVRIANIFAWGATGDPYQPATQSDDAIATYKKLLAGTL